MSDDLKKQPDAAKANGAFTGQPDDLHDLLGGSPDDPEDPLAGLRDNPDYAALIRDLEYIATQARELFKPAEETPSDSLWDKIKTQLPAKPDA